MKGQASIEALLILAAVLAVASGFLYQGIESSNSINTLEASRNGAENAISRIQIENEIALRINGISRQNENITIIIDNWGGTPPKDTEEQVREDALEFLYQAYYGNFPETDIDNVSTPHHNYTINVELVG